MMKRKCGWFVVAGALMAGILAGCGSGKDIGQDAAKAAAFQDAGVEESEVSRFRAQKDRDDGRMTYDIQFTVNGREYDYEILASDGEVLTVEVEEAQTVGTNGVSGNQTAQSTDKAGGTKAASGNADTKVTETPAPDANTGNQQNAVSGAQGTQLSIEDAKKLALERVPGSSDRDIKIELDYDDGMTTYEGDIIYDQKEYEFEIDANSGNFLKWSEERR